MVAKSPINCLIGNLEKKKKKKRVERHSTKLAKRGSQNEEFERGHTRIIYSWFFFSLFLPFTFLNFRDSLLCWSALCCTVLWHDSVEFVVAEHNKLLVHLAFLLTALEFVWTALLWGTVLRIADCYGTGALGKKVEESLGVEIWELPHVPNYLFFSLYITL